MDGAKRGYMEDSQRIIHKQQEAIDRLKEENRKLKGSLDEEVHVDAAVPTSSEYGRIMQLKELAESYRRKIDIESRKIEDQNKDADVCEAKVLNLQKLIGGANGARDNSIQLQKMCSVLENRLEKVQVKYNQLLSKNTIRRAEIEDLRKERITFENIYKKLESDLFDRKGELASRIEVSNISYEARDQAVTEMGLLRAQSDGEQTEFENEMARLGARLGIGKRERNAAIRQLLYSSVQSLSNLKGKARSSEKLLDNYEEAFERLKAVPGGDAAPGEVVASFLAEEDANLTLFNYVNELKQEKERLEEIKAEKEAELERIKKEGAVGGESNQRRQLMGELHSGHGRVKARVEAIAARNQEVMDTMQEMAGLVELVSHKVGAEKYGIVHEGRAGDLAEALREGLGALEQRADEVITMWTAFQASRSQQPVHKPGASSTHGQGPRTVNGGKLQIVAPTISGAGGGSGDDNSSDEELPMTRDQLKTKVLNKTGIAFEEFVTGVQQGKPAGRPRPVSAVVPKRSNSAGAEAPHRPISARPKPSSPATSAAGSDRAASAGATGTPRASSASGSRKKPPASSSWR